MFHDQRIGFNMRQMMPHTNTVTNEAAEKTHCKVCGKDFQQEAKLLQHKKTDGHLFREIYQSCRYRYRKLPPSLA